MKNKQTEYLNSVRQLIFDLSDALIFWTLFKEFRTIQLQKNYSKSLNFIQAVKDSAILSLMIQISKLIDNKGVSIVTLTKFLKVNSTLFEKTKEETETHIVIIENIIHRNFSIIQRLTKHRNKYHVHIDKENIKTSVLKVFQDYKIELQEIEPFLEDLLKCLCELKLCYLDNGSHPFLGLPEEEVISNYLIDKESTKTHLRIKEILEKIKNNNAT